MDKLQTMDVPADILPTSQTQRYGNQFHSRQSFPFQSYSTIPSFSVVVENILLSCGTIFASMAGLFVTMTVFLPLGILKSFVSMVARVTGYSKKRRYQNVIGMKRCVVINGARYVTILEPKTLRETNISTALVLVPPLSTNTLQLEHILCLLPGI